MGASRKRGRALLWRLLAAVALAGAMAIALWLWWSGRRVAELATRNPESTAFIDAARERGDHVEWSWVPYDRISLQVKKAVVAAEDMSFFSHHGFDTHELEIAARDAVRGKRLRGASTITQQLAKNLWLTPSRSPLRKLHEAVLTWQLERLLSKRRILELYLNVAQFGPEVGGVGAAADRYFGAPAGELDATEAAELAAALPRPSSWHPGVTSPGYRRAVERVRHRASQSDWLDRLL